MYEYFEFIRMQVYEYTYMNILNLLKCEFMNV